MSIKKEETPFEKRSCYDCGHLFSAVSWWCGSAEATKARGTKIPGCIHCPFWKPDWKVIEGKYRTPEYGYIKPPTPPAVIKKTIWQKIKSIFSITP